MGGGGGGGLDRLTHSLTHASPSPPPPPPPLIPPPQLLNAKGEQRVPASASDELASRASAAEALGAALCCGAAAGPLPAAAAAHSLSPCLKAALLLATQGAWDVGGEAAPWSHSLAVLRLRVLQALQHLPSADLYTPLHQEALALAEPCLAPGAAGARPLLLALLHPGDDALGPHPPEGDDADAALLRFDGAPLAAAPPGQPWLAPPGPFPAPEGAHTALACAQCRQFGLLWAATHPGARKALMGLMVECARRAGREAAKSGETASAEAAAANAAAAGLAAVAAAQAPGCAPLSLEDAKGLNELGCAWLGLGS